MGSISVEPHCRKPFWNARHCISIHLDPTFIRARKPCPTSRRNQPAHVQGQASRHQVQRSVKSTSWAAPRHSQGAQGSHITEQTTLPTSASTPLPPAINQGYGYGRGPNSMLLFLPFRDPGGSPHLLDHVWVVLHHLCCHPHLTAGAVIAATATSAGP